MITNFSLITIFACSLFIVICSLKGKIDISPIAKGVLCSTMLSIIGVLSKGYHTYASMSYDFMFLSIAVLVVRQTLIGYKRGFV